MSDFEDELRNTLRGRAAEAPDDPSGLAAGARRRRGARSRMVGGAAVAAVLVAAVPLGLTLFNHDRSDQQDTTAAESPGDVSSIPDGWRWESWRNVEVAVPGDWRDGSAYDLCIPGHPSPPPGNISRDGYQANFEPDEKVQAACEQSVTFLAGDPRLPLAEGPGVGERVSVAGNTLDVRAADQETLDSIVASAHEITTVDALGCSPQIEFGTADYGTAKGSVVLCEYVVGGYGTDRSTPILDSSSTLKESTATTMRDVLDGTSPLADDDKAVNGCTLSKGSPPYSVRRLQVGDVVLADLSSNSCGSVQLVTADGPQEIDYALLDALDPATTQNY